jgi:Flp pilus assembly protein TadG
MTDFMFDFGFRRFLRDRGGNFAILTAIAVPVLFAGAGVAVDLSNMLLSKGQMQTATDAAALATASALAAGSISTTTATQFAKDFVSGQMANYLGSDAAALAAVKSGTVVSVTQTANGATGKIFAVSVKSAYGMSVNGLTRILGLNTVTVGAGSSTSSATESKNALSMYLVLDRSGSMDEATATVNTSQPTTCTKTNRSGECSNYATNYYTKIESLKIAVTNLMAQLNKADPNMIYVRTGGDSYNKEAQTQSPMAWGTTDISSYVNKLTADGTTNSAPAFSNGYDALIASTENDAHKTKNGQVPTKYIVFMTDGENNEPGADDTTKAKCDAARTAGMQVYTVALMAPTAGQKLLKYCATSTATYFDAEDSDDLVAAFKAIGDKATAQLTLMTK